MNNKRRQAGISLVELGAATVVMAVALIGTVAAVLSGASLSRETIQLRAAARASAAVMEQIRSADFATITDYDGAQIDLTTVDAALDAGAATIAVDDVDNGNSQQVYRVTMTVRFDSRTHDETIRIVTYVADRTDASSLSASASLAADSTVVDTVVDTVTAHD